MGYADPNKAIGKIHSKHKDRLDKFSTRVKIPIFQTGELGENKGVEGDLKSQVEESKPQIGELGFQTGELDENKGVEGNLFHEVYYYSQHGVMEICRWSRQPKADEFMDWVWDVINGYRQSEFIPIEEYERKIAEMAAEIDSLKKNGGRIETSQNESIGLWMSKTFDKFKVVAEFLSTKQGKQCTLKKAMGEVFREMSRKYGFTINDCTRVYKQRHPKDRDIYSLKVIAEFLKCRKMLDDTLDDLAAEFGLVYSTGTAFDELRNG